MHYEAGCMCFFAVLWRTLAHIYMYLHSFSQFIFCVCVAASSQASGTRSNFHPQLVSEKEMSVMASKAHLVLRMIQLKIGHDLLLQVSSTKESFQHTHTHKIFKDPIILVMFPDIQRPL